jgi:hypothetical protein
MNGKGMGSIRRDRIEEAGWKQWLGTLHPDPLSNVGLATVWVGRGSRASVKMRFNRREKK